jgi:hypothetical protein
LLKILVARHRVLLAPFSCSRTQLFSSLPQRPHHKRYKLLIVGKGDGLLKFFGVWKEPAAATTTYVRDDRSAGVDIPTELGRKDWIMAVL